MQRVQSPPQSLSRKQVSPHLSPPGLGVGGRGASPICHFSKSLLSHVYQNSLCVLATVKQRSLPLLSMTLICFVLVSHWTCSGLYTNRRRGDRTQYKRQRGGADDHAPEARLGLRVLLLRWDGLVLRHNGWPVLNEVIYSSTQVNDKVSGALLYWRSVRHETARECLKIAALRCKLDRAWQNPS